MPSTGSQPERHTTPSTLFMTNDLVYVAHQRGISLPSSLGELLVHMDYPTGFEAR
jgi:hypothetical protein